MIDGIKKFQPYLHGHKFTVHTHHNALKWLMSIKDVTGRLARLSLFIQQFDFEIKHRPGIANGNADGLSRCAYSTLRTLAVLEPLSAKLARIHEMQHKDTTLAPLITYLETKMLPNEENCSRTVVHQADQFLLDD